MKTPSPFALKVVALIKKIPKGKVATYGQIAALAGKPHAARGVSWILHSSSEKQALPWHRVLGSAGTISFPRLSSNYAKQKRLLKSEGVVFSALDEKIDLEKFQWSRRARRSLRGW